MSEYGTTISIRSIGTNLQIAKIWLYTITLHIILGVNFFAISLFRIGTEGFYFASGDRLTKYMYTKGCPQ